MHLFKPGYTERYMDLPEHNKEGYANGSVLSYINQFPDEWVFNSAHRKQINWPI